MKVQVNLNDEFVTDLDKYASEIGISRSALCAMLIRDAWKQKHENEKKQNV